MTDLYFLKIFFISKIIPYTLMTASITHILLEMIAPKEIRYVFYDFADRLFFKFVYRPINKILSSLKGLFLFNLKKFRDFLTIHEKKKRLKEYKKNEKKILKNERKQQAIIVKNQRQEIKKQKRLSKKEEKLNIKNIKKEEKLQASLAKKEEKLYYKIENKRLKNETIHKIKLLIEYQIRKREQKKKIRQLKQ